MVDSFNPSFRVDITICYNCYILTKIKHGTHIATYRSRAKAFAGKVKNDSNTITSKGQRYDHEVQKHYNQNVNYIDLFNGHVDRSPDNGHYR